jgi:hypothetical protein
MVLPLGRSAAPCRRAQRAPSLKRRAEFIIAAIYATFAQSLQFAHAPRGGRLEDSVTAEYASC